MTRCQVARVYPCRSWRERRTLRRRAGAKCSLRKVFRASSKGRRADRFVDSLRINSCMLLSRVHIRSSSGEGPEWYPEVREVSTAVRTETSGNKNVPDASVMCLWIGYLEKGPLFPSHQDETLPAGRVRLIVTVEFCLIAGNFRRQRAPEFLRDEC